MTFQNLEYKRPDQDTVLKHIAELKTQLESAADEAAFLAALKAVNELHRDIESMASLCYIRHSIDTTDSFYKTEMDHLDEILPSIMEANQKLQITLLQSPHRPYLEAVLGKTALERLELSTRTISAAVLDDLVSENKLVSEYSRLLASASLEFDGKQLNLQQMGPYLEASSRDTRRAAVDTMFGFYHEHDTVLDDIYDRLVKIRHKIARTLGFENFVALGYARMGRTDYDGDMVATYRKQVLQTIVPLACSLRQKQQARLGLSRLFYYDEPLSDPKGNPKPLGDADELMNKASVMFAELSPGTDAFFTFMKQAGAMDLIAKPGKETGGYCTFLPNWQMPFIFANFNGTKDDVEVFTHEGGHAYQAYVTRDDEWLSHHEPGMETAEIHSMSMEFLTWPWMDLFFGKDADRFRYNHLADALMFIPYGVAVDHYQHLVYENPAATPEERRQFWLDVESTYLPWRDYDENTYLKGGNVWKRQTHIFSAPFYYIDYTLAQVLALWFWQAARNDAAIAWQQYDRLCRDGGKLGFRLLLEAHNLPNVFEAGSLDHFIPAVSAYLESVDPLTL